MEFVEVGFSYLFPIALLYYFLGNKGISKNIITTLNFSLLFFVLFLCRQYYELYNMAKIFGVTITPEGLWQLMMTNKPVAFKNTLTLLLPLLFISKKLSQSIMLGGVMLVLLWWDVCYAVVKKENYSLPISLYNPLLFPILKYTSLLIGLFGFLYITKRLKNQYTKQNVS